MNKAEEFLLAFHRLHPGCTSLAFAQGKSVATGQSSYELLSCLAANDRTLDLGCGDGHLVELLSSQCFAGDAVGLDFSPEELSLARKRGPHSLLRARAQALPFADHSFSLVVSHLAFHLMSEIEAVVAEIGRVLEPGGRFAAIVGGGPKIGGSFEQFLDLLAESKEDRHSVPRLGEMRARTEEGLRALFAEGTAFDARVQIDDYEVDFGGSFDQLWPRLAQVYDLIHHSPHEMEALREGLRRRLAVAEQQYIPCTMAIRRVICQRRST